MYYKWTDAPELTKYSPKVDYLKRTLATIAVINKPHNH